MTFLLSNWQYIVIALLAAALTLMTNLWQGEVKAFAEFKGAVVVLGQEAAKETKRVNDLHATTLKETNDEWNKKLPKISSSAIDNYKRRFPRGLCGNTSESTVPRHANSTEASNGTKPERVASGEGITTSTTGDPQGDAFIAECGKDAAKLKSLRSWVTKNQLPVEN